ncbi:cytokinesis protein 3, partial [Ascosphaera atra]
MESRLRQLHAQNARKGSDELHFARTSEDQDVLPPLPSIGNPSRHQSPAIEDANARMGKRRSGFNTVGRSSTNRSSATNSSSGVQSTMTNLTNSTNSTGLTGQSVMSGYSASGFSATSAGSFARRGKVGGGSFNRSRPNTSMETHTPASTRPQSPATGPSYHSSHNTSRQGATSALGHSDYSQPSPAVAESERPVSPNKKKSGFFRKMIESARSAKSSAANSRSVKATSGAASPSKSSRLGSALSHSRLKSHSSSKDIGQGPADWVQVRRDVNRAITPSKLELMEKAERCQMMDFPVIYAIEDLYETAEGDEGIDGLPIEEPTDWANMNLAMVDKNTRYLGNIPATLSPAVLAQSYVCRPYRTDGQRLRAIFTWVSEKITWEEEAEGEVDVRKAIHMRRGSPREIAMLVQEMCSAVGIHSEVVEGYLKTPGEDLDLDCLSRPNHFWNTVLIDGEWRIMDCSLASPTHPGRYASSILNTNAAESWYFLARPMEICYTHVPLIPEQQHIVPPVADDVLLALPW